MSKMLRVVAVSALMVVGLAVCAHASIVQNGNFDADNPPGGTAPMGWTLVNAASGSDFFVGGMPTFGALSAPNSANFGAVGSLDDVLSQILTTVPGQTYTLDFWLSHNSTNGANDFSVMWNSTTLLSLLNASSFNWTEYTYSVVGSGSDTLTFSGRDVPAWYGVDNVTVDPTPEPGTLILLGSGLLGLGGLVRRKIGL